MRTQADTRAPLAFEAYRPVVVMRDGIVTGLMGAATIMLWFLVLDAIHGRPLYTPTVLGTVLLGVDTASLRDLPVSLPVVLFYTAVHCLAFCAVGYVAAWLFAVAEHHPPWIFGLLLFFILFFCAFLAVPIVAKPRVFDVVTVPAILAGNFLAAVVMGGRLWRRHPLRLPQLV